MGIQGLLPLLKSIHRPTELKKHAGETFAVDAYGWLHRGAIACAIELAEGKPTQKYVAFCMRRVRMMQHFGVTPYLVFDGGHLPSKSDEEAHRRKRRQESRQAGLELLRAGKPSLAHKELQKAVDITPEMARNLIEELIKMDLPYVVAPYEADPQMVYLERQGLVSGIVSEDSDLLVFGAKRLFTKLDDHGQCIEINRRDFAACRDLHMADWTDAQFRQMAIFRGCDYLGGLKDLGLKTAYRLLRKYKTPEKVISRVLLEGKIRVPPNFLEQFRQAELTFLHQRVYCPKAQEQVFLTPIPEGLYIEDMPFLGPAVEAPLAQAMAAGSINPITKTAIVLPPSPESRKRRASSSAQTVGSAERHPKKPIDSYFKKHGRIPLGNMDPNCFSIDPQRSATVGENDQQPIVFPLPRPYIDETSTRTNNASRPYTNRTYDPAPSRTLRRRTEPITKRLLDIGHDPASSSRRQTLGSAQQSSNLSQRSNLAPSARPPKKARLCDDSVLESSPDVATSKFFPAGRRSGTAFKSDSYLLSDDSIEDVLRGLPDVDGWKSKNGKRISVFEEPPQESTRSNSRDNNEAVHTASAHRATASETAVSSTIRQFAFQQTSTSNPAKTQCGSTPQPTILNSAQSITARSTPCSLTSTASTISTTMSTPATPLMTPLQRLGARAMNSSRQPPTLTFAVPHLVKRKGISRRSLDNLPINPSFVPLPPMDLAEVEALHKTEGSEDLILPESENEDDGQDDVGNRSHGTRRMDLSRFLFA